jgi:RNA polymerase sigma factor (TIGR02999 family)
MNTPRCRNVTPLRFIRFPPPGSTIMVAPHEISARTDEPSESTHLDEIFAAAYDELCDLASTERRRWRGNETLDTTALVHEVYLKLARQAVPLRNPSCLFAVAARAMRHVLVNYAERQQATKRGGQVQMVPLATLGHPGGELADVSATAEEVLALNAAMERLAALSVRQRDVVECRFFGGLSVEETADALELSPATVKRDWRMARAWLHRDLTADLLS